MYNANMLENITINKTTTKGHACFFYTDITDRYTVLTQYFKDGLVNNELCIFATADSTASTIQNFLKAGLDIRDSVENKSLRIFEMKATYTPNGKFVADYMLNNVRDFIKSAEKEGYSGLRTAGEMTWTKDHPEAVDDAINYEHKINGLCTDETNFIGLCLYAMKDDYSKVMRGAVRSHPSFIYDGQVKTNPYFVPA